MATQQFVAVGSFVMGGHVHGEFSWQQQQADWPVIGPIVSIQHNVKWNPCLKFLPIHLFFVTSCCWDLFI
jgi:hypothetical protein